MPTRKRPDPKTRPKVAVPKRAKTGTAAMEPEPSETTAAVIAPDIERIGTKLFPIVGIGASAGGFEAFRELMQALPNDTGMAFVLVQHLDPGHESMLTRLLSKATPMPVSEVQDGMEVEPNHVYVIPPNTTMTIREGVLHLMARAKPTTRHMPVDSFLRSLAEDQGSSAIGVILSGTASDGTLGLQAIKAEGGITFAQDEKSAKYDGMPRSAIVTGCVDFIMPPKGIAKELAHIGRHPYLGIAHPVTVSEPPPREDHLRAIFRLVRQATGVDFTHYKYNTIKRRIARRMLFLKIEDPRQYVKYLRGNRAELEALYQDILIHVTSFFREPECFQALKDDVFPKIMSDRRPRDPVRIWVPGCSTGEEVYSIAISLLEYLGDRANATRINIFGTDISEAAVDKARAGTYTENSLVDVTEDQLRRFFIKLDGDYQITKSVREMCVFARQDLAKDPPFSKLDLVSCRNVLIYMGPTLQKRVLAAFHYALKPTGLLLLGRSESISGFSDLFTIVDRKDKIYARRAGEPRPLLDITTTDYERLVPETPQEEGPHADFDVLKEADRIALNRYAPAGCVIDENLQIVQFRGKAALYVSPSPGQATLNLLKMVRPELVLEVRTAINKAKKQEAPIRKDRIVFRHNGQSREISLEVTPIPQPGSGCQHYLVLFEEPGARPAQTPPPVKGRSKRPAESEVSRLGRELATTKEYLQSIIEDQEATNEELKSANEEVLSSNEELQSTNEELETAKEELQSANEELVTVNETLQNRNAELAQLSDDLANLLSGVNIPIVMLGNDRRIRRFTPLAENLLNLLPTDIGRPIGNIKPNIQVPDLEAIITDVIDNVVVREQDVQNNEGRWYSMRVRPYRTVENRIDGVVMIFIDVDAIKRGRDELQQERDFVSAVLDTTGAAVTVLDREGRIVRANRACQRISGYSFQELKDQRPWDILVPPEHVAQAKAMFEQTLSGQIIMQEQKHWLTKDGRRRLLSVSSAVLRDADGAVKYVIRSYIDITDQRLAEQARDEIEGALRRSQEDLRAIMARLLTAQEEERKRLSRELHDDLNQKLAMLTVEIEALERKLPASAAAFRSRLHSLRDRIAGLSDDVRGTAYQLHPSAIEHLGLGPALKSYCGDVSRQERLKVRFTQRNLPASIPADVALCLYRVTQEALRNVARHSEADRAWVSLTGVDNVVRLYVGDSGVGFDPSTRRSGLGIVSMEERVRLVGGSFSLKTELGDGVRIDVEVPLRKPSKTTKKAASAGA